jgi:hypothetical protein
VTLGDRVYRTIDWSIGGLCIAGFAGKVQADAQMNGSFKIAGILDAEAVFSDRCIVMRYDSMTGILATRFKSWPLADAEDPRISYPPPYAPEQGMPDGRTRDHCG